MVDSGYHQLISFTDPRAGRNNHNKGAFERHHSGAIDCWKTDLMINSLVDPPVVFACRIWNVFT